MSPRPSTPHNRRTRGAIRAAFWLWALTLFTLTHWPGLAIEGVPIERPDLYAHLGVFGLWGALLAWGGFFGPPVSLRNAGLSLLTGVVYAAIDESLQLIPALRRHAGFDDFAANTLGLALGVSGAMLVARWLAARRANHANNPTSMG
ncbi:MAG: VanZ family protein [Phycisphaerales bacterium]|jgi:VanZ family protein|nr:VanZ family protein [Phycisphaerales bacterium]